MQHARSSNSSKNCKGSACPSYFIPHLRTCSATPRGGLASTDEPAMSLSWGFSKTPENLDACSPVTIPGPTYSRVPTQPRVCPRRLPELAMHRVFAHSPDQLRIYGGSAP
ncbi:hypothetical protein ACLKA7_007791 [Drosophila subpalustris]